MGQKHIHFIGICGVGMSALAILWQKKGWKVTGSDVGFYPPISTHLTEHKIEYYPGWHVEKMGTPDLVVVGNVAGSENPELKFVLDNNIPHVSYPELIAQNLLKENSIVCAGTYGKTTTTALLAWILKEAGLDPAYMFGGIANSLELSADDLGGEYSVIEGDEYKTSREDLRAKFFSYKPTQLLLTAVRWDHADVYPTEQSYLEAFEKLIQLIPSTGLIVACTDNATVKNLIKKANSAVVTYGKENSNYIYEDILQSKSGLTFTIENIGEVFEITSPMLGDYMAENICGAFVMAKEIGIEPEKIVSAIAKFDGIKRRLEKREQTSAGADVYDDIAHSPIKAKSVLATLKNIYTGKIIAVFEPNTGNRQLESFADYDNQFSEATEVIIPRLTKVKTPGSIEGEELKNVIAKTHSNVKYFDIDEDLINYLKTNTTYNDVIVFMGSHSFRGMIDLIVKE
jgi:UDP-N-acetylmuramate: L-alanyl-gamma-D-glutamyl-meso-diaminopimelate ligase